MKTQHTPGPWTVNPNYVCDVDAGDVKVSTSWSVDEIGCTLKVPNRPMPTVEEQEANTRLIAAAPDLLRVLQLMEECHSLWAAPESATEENTNPEHWGEVSALLSIRSHIRSAIAKATTPQP